MLSKANVLCVDHFLTDLLHDLSHGEYLEHIHRSQALLTMLDQLVENGP